VTQLNVAGLILLTFALGAVEAGAVWFRDTVMDDREFSDHVVTALGTTQTREVIARRVTEQTVERAPAAWEIRPVIRAVVQTVLASDAFRPPSSRR